MSDVTRGQGCRRRDCVREAVKRKAIGAFETVLCSPCFAQLERDAKFYGGYAQTRKPRPAGWGWRVNPQVQEQAALAGGGMEVL